VAVVARPDVFWGETPCAFVSLKSGFDSKTDGGGNDRVL
jgi:acyl-CoA synthetase (AMP-forming)/AMP-acid ligase II